MFTKAFLVILTLISLYEDSNQIAVRRQAVEGQFPWAVALFQDGRLICGASIINPRSILTSAYCFASNRVTSEATTLHGIANLRKSSPTQRIEFSHVIPHPDYKGVQNDILLLVTKEPVEFSPTVGPVCIANESTGANLTDKTVTAMGWGYTTNHHGGISEPEILEYVEQSVIESQTCNLTYPGLEIDSSKLCTGIRSKRICNGDGGGPLVYSAGGTPVQVGIASYRSSSRTACVSKIPSVFTRVSAYSDFIKKNAADPDDICFA